MPARVIAGSARGRRLKLVPGDSTRPVMDRVKEACFNIIGRDIYDARFLDLYAGTGSVGIEALSRGAARAVFVELDRLAVKTIHENLELTGLKAHAVVRRADVLQLLQQPAAEAFDFIYVAPPQYKNLWLQTLTALDTQPAWIPPGTVVIAQIDPTEQQAVTFKHLTGYDERRYGSTLLWFFQAHEPRPDTLSEAT
jgi:16S rRNA (guanine(966)-N(2))-methyltransferase RsmD